MLSVLICSMESRWRQRGELLSCLQPQVGDFSVEILVETDKGEMPIGQKRNVLLHRATKQYVVFVDDDDMVDDNYIVKICSEIDRYKFQHNGEVPDCVGICGYIRGGKSDGWQFRHSITVGRWCKDKRNRIYYRTPNHLNPILAKYARMCRFPETNHGEDRAFSEQIRPFLNTETYIDWPLYFYKMGNK